MLLVFYAWLLLCYSFFGVVGVGGVSEMEITWGTEPLLIMGSI